MRNKTNILAIAILCGLGLSAVLSTITLFTQKEFPSVYGAAVHYCCLACALVFVVIRKKKGKF